MRADSLIYITVLSDTNNQVLFVSEQSGQKDNEYFTVKVKNPLPDVTRFNFLLINQ